MKIVPLEALNMGPFFCLFAGGRRFDKGQFDPISKSRVYSHLSGSSGDIDTDPRESPCHVPEQQQQKLLDSNRQVRYPRLLVKQLDADNLRHPHETGFCSSTDNNSDANLTDTDLALSTSGTLALRGKSPTKNRNQENPSVRQLSNSTRNISSSSMANRSLNSRQVGTKPGGGGGGDCNHHENDFEPSCLIRTPSGSLFIPSDYQTNTASPIHQEHSSPTHLNDHKSYNSDRFTVPYTSTMPVPVLPVRNDLRRPSTYTFPSSRFKFGKAVSKRCSWKCVAIVFILLFLALLPVLAYFIGKCRHFKLFSSNRFL
ncbi:Uncharacterised protein g5188 [Pycnogonum litorale]